MLNFKLFLLLILLNSCGVKSDPMIPAGSEIPSFIEPFLDDANWDEPEEMKAKK